MRDRFKLRLNALQHQGEPFFIDLENDAKEMTLEEIVDLLNDINESKLTGGGIVGSYRIGTYIIDEAIRRLNDE